ncbi:MAG: M28 family peptidase [Candidatus Eiseniibacteriota bacterium]
MITERTAGAFALILALAFAGCEGPGRRFDSARAFRDLEMQVEAGPRIPGSEGHRRVREYLETELARCADHVHVHRFTAVSPWDSTTVTLENVVAVFGETSSERLLLGAHWDTRPAADHDPDPARRGEPVPGANDAASGTAVLLEVARALAADPPRIGVDLVFFDGEDSGVDDRPETFALGSQRFVADHPAYRPSLVVILDMVGRRGSRFLRETNSDLAARPAVTTIWRIARDLGIDAFVDSAGPAMWDDHIAFLQAGIPAVDVIDPTDPAWHTTGDLPGNCSAEALDDTGRVVLELIGRMERAHRP